MKINIRSTLLLGLTLVLAAAIVKPLLEGDLPLRFGTDLSGGVIVAYQPNFENQLSVYSSLTEMELLLLCKEIISKRLSAKLSVVPEVVVRGDQTIVVTVPKEGNYKEVLNLVGKTYHLTMRLVADKYPEQDQNKSRYRYEGTYLELAEPSFSGYMLDPNSIKHNAADPTAVTKTQQHATVSFAFRPPFDATFEEFTSQYIGRELAILLDDQIEFSGVIKNRITESATLSGGYTNEEALNIALMLRSGTLPLSLHVQSLSAVGPSLGQDIQDRGLVALLLATFLLLLVLFFAYVHRTWFLLAGTLSMLALFFFISGLVALFDLTLDIAGIAGLILSLGMGFDAFIIIFESLEPKLANLSRDHLARYSKDIIASIYSFRYEGKVLLHANLSTVLVISLVWMTERLRSFALFIFVGIAASILSIFVTRAILRRTYGLIPNLGPDLLHSLRQGHHDLFHVRKTYYYSLILFLVAGIVSGVFSDRPLLRLGPDFRHGTMLTASAPSEDLLDSFQSDLKAAFPQLKLQARRLGSHEESRLLLTLDAPLDIPSGSSEHLIDHKEDTFAEDKTVPLEDLPLPAFGESLQTMEGNSPGAVTSLTPQSLITLAENARVNVTSLQSIDNRVSLRRTVASLSALLASFVLLSLYFLSQNFIDGFFTSDSSPAISSNRSRLLVSLGVILAVTSDVVLVFVFMHFLEIELSLAVLAAMLAIIGYSVNDSVVLWSHVERKFLDSVGEQAAPNLDLENLVRVSINSILSRAFLTTLSTILPAVSILVVRIEPLTDFALVIIAGTIAGTLSSIFIMGAFSLKALREETSPSPTDGPSSHPDNVEADTIKRRRELETILKGQLAAGSE